MKSSAPSLPPAAKLAIDLFFVSKETATVQRMLMDDGTEVSGLDHTIQDTDFIFKCCDPLERQITDHFKLTIRADGDKTSHLDSSASGLWDY